MLNTTSQIQDDHASPSLIRSLVFPACKPNHSLHSFRMLMGSYFSYMCMMARSSEANGSLSGWRLNLRPCFFPNPYISCRKDILEHCPACRLFSYMRTLKHRDCADSTTKISDPREPIAHLSFFIFRAGRPSPISKNAITSRNVILKKTGPKSKLLLS